MEYAVKRLAGKSRNQKGMTLVELLAVIVIMGIVAAIATAAVGGIISKSKTNADSRTEEMIKSAAETWAMDNNVTTTQTAEDIETELVGKAYLRSTSLVLQSDSTKKFGTFTVTVDGTTGAYTITVNKVAVS